MVTLSKTLQQIHERQGDTFNRIPVRYIRPSFFRDCRSCVPILANARVAKLTFFGMLYIRRCPFRVAGLGHQRLSSQIHHGRRFRSSGNGAWLVWFIPPCSDGLRGCWGTPQVRGSIGGGAILRRSSHLTRRLNSRHRRCRHCPRQ